jgi:hypothetical protein
MAMYSALITEGAISHTCSHLHGSIAEALDCAAEQVRQPGTTTTVVAAESHPDGLPRHRDLDAGERAELAALLNSGRGRG